MVNDVLDAITKQLGQTFGSSYRYYVENVEQDLQKPCFTVDMLEPRERSINYKRYRRTMPVVVHYFNEERDTNKKDCYSMAERLVECLEYLTFKDTVLRGENISWQLVEGVLQVLLTYRFITVAKPDDEKMYYLEEVGVETPFVVTPNDTKSVLGVGRLGYMVLGED